jgi:adenosine deaminase
MELQSLPKIELHLRLDCSLSYPAVARLAPHVTQEEYESDYVAPARCANLADFLARAPKGFLLIQTEDSLRHVTEDLFQQLIDDGVITPKSDLCRCCIPKEAYCLSGSWRLWSVRLIA